MPSTTTVVPRISPCGSSVVSGAMTGSTCSRASATGRTRSEIAVSEDRRGDRGGSACHAPTVSNRCSSVQSGEPRSEGAAYAPPVITALKHDGGHVATIDDPEDIDDFARHRVPRLGRRRAASPQRTPIASSTSSRSTTSPSGGHPRRWPSHDRRHCTPHEDRDLRAPRVHRRVLGRPVPGEPPRRSSDWVTTFRQPNEAGQTWPIDTCPRPLRDRATSRTLGKLVWCVLDALVDDCLGRLPARSSCAIETIEQSIFGSEPLERGATRRRLQRRAVRHPPRARRAAAQGAADGGGRRASCATAT